MTPKERILAVLDRKPVDRIPVDLWHTGEVAAMLRGHFGVADDLAMWSALGLDKIVWAFASYRQPEWPDGLARSGWGASIRTMQAGLATYGEVAEAPMRDLQTPADLDRYPYWPDPARFTFDSEFIQRAAQEFATIGPWVSFFEIYCQMRGLEQAMMDLFESPELVEAGLDRIEEIQTRMMGRMFAEVGRYLNLVFVSDDIGGQNGMLLSPADWRRHLKPRVARWCKLIHEHNLRVFYHSDGGFAPVIDELIECGIDVLNPIQHVCPGMEMAELKRKYGSKIIFHGGVDNQFALPRGTVDDVRRETLDCLRTLGAGREGYICASCHNVQPGTPLENILAMVKTVHEEG